MSADYSCNQTSDCPPVNCYVAPCPTYSCINNTCVLSSQTNTTPACTDSDGGLNYGIKGTITPPVTSADFDVEIAGWNKGEDSCALIRGGNSATVSSCSGMECSLLELYCVKDNPNQRVFFQYNDCQYGCKDGACISQTNTTQACTDSDGGLSYYVKGSVTGQNEDDPREVITSASDGCDGRVLHEFVCKTSTQYDDEVYTCPNGCSNGACISQTNTAPACTDSDGRDYYTKGSVKDTTGERFDYCKIGDEGVQYVTEYFCSSSGENSYEPFKCPNGCKDGACVKGEIITEKITCKFEGTEKEQRCYLAGQFTDADLGTKYCIASMGAGGSCEINYKGYNGEQVTWKSSCGQYQYTTQDGVDEVIYFKCSEGETNITEIAKKGFRKVYFQCYDGEESSSIEREVCKSADYWKKFASNFCRSHCENNPEKCKQKYENQEDIDKCLGKCGVNTFSIGEECYLGEGLCKEWESINGCCERWAGEHEVARPDCVGGWNIEGDRCSWSCKIEEGSGISGSIAEPVVVCKDSCPLEGKCYPFGYRKSGNYCSDNGNFVEQMEGDKTCDNNFECSSNVCVDGKCIESGFLQRIIAWFKKLFG